MTLKGVESATSNVQSQEVLEVAVGEFWNAPGFEPFACRTARA
jgi:hypothetical protein